MIQSQMLPSVDNFALQKQILHAYQAIRTFYFTSNLVSSLHNSDHILAPFHHLCLGLLVLTVWSAAQSSKEGLQALPCTTCNLQITAACPAALATQAPCHAAHRAWCLGLASKVDLKPKGPLLERVQR